jgi:hypothetical protein
MMRQERRPARAAALRAGERVLAMARAGTISPEEADRLLAALQVARRERPSLSVLIQPMDVLSPRAAWISATAVTFASFVVGRLGVRYDGALDLHRVSGAPPWPIVLFDGANSVILTAVVLWLVARLFTARVRLVDFVMTVALARLPQVCAGLVAIVTIPNPDTMVRAVLEAAANRTPVEISLLLGAVVLLPFFAWFLALLYFGFRTSSGLSPARTAPALAVGLVAAEVLSKLALSALVA